MSECGEPTAQCAYLSIGPVILRVVGCLQLHHAVQGASLCCLCSKDSRRWIHGRSAADAAQIVLGSAQNESPSALDRCSTRSDEGCRRYSHNVLLFKRDAASQARCGDVIGRARHEPPSALRQPDRNVQKPPRGRRREAERAGRRPLQSPPRASPAARVVWALDSQMPGEVKAKAVLIPARDVLALVQRAQAPAWAPHPFEERCKTTWSIAVDDD